MSGVSGQNSRVTAQIREAKAAQELAALRSKKAGAGRTILGIDPGTAATGIGLLKNGKPELLRVVHVRGKTVDERIKGMCLRVRHAVQGLVDEHSPDTVVLEWQEPRPDDPRPRDIANLCIVLGAVLSVELSPFTTLLTPLPVSWKGSAPGDLTVARILKHFGPIPEEVWGDTLPSLQHNAVDGLGLALWAVNRRLPWA